MKSIAIMIATYNGEKFLSEQLESIFAQDYENWHLYIQDDGSTDHTLDIIKKWRESYSNKITLFINEGPNHGACQNFASLFNKVKGYDYYCFADQDDYWAKNKLSSMVSKIVEYDKVPTLEYCDLYITDSKLNIIHDSFFEYNQKWLPSNKLEYHMLFANYIPGCCMFFNSELRNIIGNISKNIIMHDWYLLLVTVYFGNIIYNDEKLNYYRQHENNTVGAKQVKKNFKDKILRFCKETIAFWTPYKKLLIKKLRIQNDLFFNNYKISDTHKYYYMKAYNEKLKKKNYISYYLQYIKYK